MRVAIVHHWFVTRGGGERVAECIASLFRSAEIFTLLVDPQRIPEGIQRNKFHTSFLQKIPFARRFHRHLLPFYPSATESLDLRGFDLVISSDSGPIKGVRLDPGAIHICYCHSPMRYLYDGYETYRGMMGPVTRAFFSLAARHVRRWDTEAARRVTYFVANSKYIADRIQRVYARDSEVIYPPIDLHYAHSSSTSGDHYLCAGRLVGYKRTELAIAACAQLGRKLKIAGAGPEEPSLRRLVEKADITFLGELSTKQLWQEYANCRALLFAADEDFGMIPLEVQACGRPVVAYGLGGSLETVRGTGENPTGVYFAEQTEDSLMRGILQFEAAERKGVFDSNEIRAWATNFDTPIFLERMREFILSVAPEAEKEMLSPRN